MKYCNKCKVSVNNPVSNCPLCYAVISSVDSSPEIKSYPDFTLIQEKYNLIFRILLFLSITFASVSIAINIFATPHLMWSAVVVGNIIYMWIALSTAIKRRGKIGFNVFIQALSLSALLVFIDAFAGYKNWALNYVVPLLFITATLSITIIIIINRVDIGGLVLYFFLTALLGFIPIIMLLLGKATVLWPSLSCALYSGISMLSIFIFADKTTKTELKKRLHI